MNTETSMNKRQDTGASEPRKTTTPAVDIYENKDEVLLVADLPGVSPEGIAIQFQKDELTIEGRRTKVAEGSPLAAEFRQLDFQRTFVVPQGIQADGITAEMAHGVLRVHLPKRTRAVRQIAVKAG